MLKSLNISPGTHCFVISLSGTGPELWKGFDDETEEAAQPLQRSPGGSFAASPAGSGGGSKQRTDHGPRSFPKRMRGLIVARWSLTKASVRYEYLAFSKEHVFVARQHLTYTAMEKASPRFAKPHKSTHRCGSTLCAKSTSWCGGKTSVMMTSGGHSLWGRWQWIVQTRRVGSARQKDLMASRITPQAIRCVDEIPVTLLER